jgi:hypothetical protein
LGTVSVDVGCGAATTGITGIVGGEVTGPTVLANGNALGPVTEVQELTPRFAISQEPSGIPTLGLPPGVVGVVDVSVDGDVGGPLDPAPHIPDTPTVPIAKFVDSPPIGEAAGFVGDADGVDIPAICAVLDVVAVFVIAVMPAVAAVAVDADPIAIPPPS